MPLGYDVQDKQLSINGAEAETVRALFRLYLECSTVQELIDRARDAGLVTKQRRFSDGRLAGGRSFTRGHLYQLLSNPLYIGEVAHREARHSGRHQAIIDRALFDAVQRRLKANRVRRQAQKNAESPGLLTGLLFDEAGDRLCPTHANKSGRRYPYYTSQRLIHRADPSAQGWRFPARELDQAVIDPLVTFLRDAGRLMEALPACATPDQLRQVLDRARSAAGSLESDYAERRLLLKRLVSRVIVSATSFCLEVSRQGLLEIVFPDAALQPIDGESVTLNTAFQLKRRGRQARLVVGEARATRRPDTTLIALVAKAHHWFGQLATGAAASIREVAAQSRVHPSDIGRVLPLAFLAPDIVEAILTGAQPTELTAWRLKRLPTLPMAWESQRQVLGF